MLLFETKSNIPLTYSLQILAYIQNSEGTQTIIRVCIVFNFYHT